MLAEDGLRAPPSIAPIGLCNQLAERGGVVQALAEGGALLLQVRKADAAVAGNRDNEHRIEDGDDRQDREVGRPPVTEDVLVVARLLDVLDEQKDHIDFAQGNHANEHGHHQFRTTRFLFSQNEIYLRGLAAGYPKQAF